MHNEQNQINQALRFHEVRKRTGLSRSTIWRLEDAGNFPRRFPLTSRSVAWWAAEVDQWLAERRKADLKTANALKQR